MDFLELLRERNAHFASTAFRPDLGMLPSRGTILLGCVDPRVDPAVVLNLQQGEVAVIRNVGGRVNRALLETLAILRVVARAAGREGGITNLVLLHHTDCGIVGCWRHAPDLLATHLGVAPDALDEGTITDPSRSVAQDIALLRANDQLPGEIVVSGLVYDVKTGLVEVVVPPAPLSASRPPSS